MTSLNDEVENILNGKFENDLALGFLNDVNYNMQPRQPSPQIAQFGQHPGPIAAPPRRQQHAQPHHTPQMAHAHPHAQGPIPHTPTGPSPGYRGTPQQLAAQLAAQANSQMPQRPQRSPKIAERIHCLLHINNELIRQLQSTSPRTGMYIECFKRLECNIYYLHALASDDKAQQAVRMMPKLLTPPAEIPSLVEPYQRLQSLGPS